MKNFSIEVRLGAPFSRSELAIKSVKVFTVSPQESANIQDPQVLPFPFAIANNGGEMMHVRVRKHGR